MLKTNVDKYSRGISHHYFKEKKYQKKKEMEMGYRP